MKNMKVLTGCTCCIIKRFEENTDHTSTKREDGGVNTSPVIFRTTPNMVLKTNKKQI